MTDATDAREPSVSTARTPAVRRGYEHVLRFVTALSMGGLGAMRGCGGGAIACNCPSDGSTFSVSTTYCSASQQDAGCTTYVEGVGPLPPPELSEAVSNARRDPRATRDACSQHIPTQRPRTTGAALLPQIDADSINQGPSRGADALGYAIEFGAR